MDKPRLLDLFCGAGGCGSGVRPGLYDENQPEPMRGTYCPECLRVVDSLDPTHAPGCPNGPPWDGDQSGGPS